MCVVFAAMLAVLIQGFIVGGDVSQKVSDGGRINVVKYVQSRISEKRTVHL
jgi:hypothetical protein